MDLLGERRIKGRHSEDGYSNKRVESNFKITTEEKIRRNRIETISLASSLSLTYFVCFIYTKIVNPSRTTVVKEHAKKLRN